MQTTLSGRLGWVLRLYDIGFDRRRALGRGAGLGSGAGGPSETQSEQPESSGEKNRQGAIGGEDKPELRKTHGRGRFYSSEFSNPSRTMAWMWLSMVLPVAPIEAGRLGVVALAQDTLLPIMLSRDLQLQRGWLGVSLVFLLGCAAPFEEPTAPPRALRIGLYSEILSLDPYLNDEFLTFSVLSSIYEPLVFFDADLRLRPTLAVSWENPTDLIWRFDLRPDVFFHDGQPMTADDVVFSLRRAIDHPETNLASYVVAVDEVRAVDESTVEIVTRKPYPILLNKLTHILILPKGTPDRLERAVGTGPYRVTEWRPGTLELEAYLGYWGPPVKEPLVQMVSISDRDERVRRLLEGEVDLVLDLTSHDIARVEGAPETSVASWEGLTVDYLQMNITRPPFDDARVRRAIHLAIDREAWVEEVLLGRGVPANQMVARSVFGFAPELPPAGRDLEASRRLLAEAGFESGLDLVLESRTSRQGGEVLRRQLAAAGIRVELRGSPWKDLFARLQAHDVDFYHGAVLASTGDASDVLDSKFHTRTVGWGQTNFNGYSNRAVDTLIESSGTTLDMRRRRRALERGMAMVMEDLPVVPIAVVSQIYGVRNNVVFQPRVDGRVLPQEVYRSTSAGADE